MSADRYLNPWADAADAAEGIPDRPWFAALVFALTLAALIALGLAWWLLAGSADF